jgi:hypothetical protein
MSLHKCGKYTKAVISEKIRRHELVESHEHERENEMKVLRVLLLVLTLSVCTYAGDMPFGRAGNMPNDKTGDMPCGKTSAVDPVTEIALQLLQSLLPLV